MARGLSDRRRGVGGAGDRDRGPDLRGARPGGKATEQPIQLRQVMDRRRGAWPRWTRTSRPRWRPLNVPAGIEDLLRELAPQVLGALARRYATSTSRGRRPGSADRCCDSLASRRRPRGAPRLADPDRFPAAGSIRERSDGCRRAGGAGVDTRAGADASAADDTLPLLFMCCHPALTRHRRSRLNPPGSRRL